MMIDLNFLKAVEKIRDPLTGTENMAPLLYFFVKSLRPVNLLEYGIGYSTLFLLKALEENVKSHCFERQHLASKNIPHDYSFTGDCFNNFFFDKHTAFLNPKFYIDDYKPKLVCFEKLPGDHPYCSNMINIINDLGLAEYLHLIHGNACEESHKIPAEFLPLDFIWNDDDSYYKFFKAYWELMNSETSYILYHSTEASTSLGFADLEKIKKALSYEDGHELLTMVEPHKLHQNSFTVIRKSSEKNFLRFDIPSDQEKIVLSHKEFKNKLCGSK